MKGDQAHVPAWRPDVLGDADLVEEIARVASLANLKGVPLPKRCGHFKASFEHFSKT